MYACRGRGTDPGQSSEPGGGAPSIAQLTQKNGEWPAAIHNNFIVGADNKRERFQNISMWMVRPDLTCRPFPHYLPAMPRGPLSFIFKVGVAR